MQTRPRNRGFTLLEMAVTVAIVGVLAALAVSAYDRGKPRASLATTSQELDALLRNARLNALSTGNPTIVAVFPDLQNRKGGFGRVVVLEDPEGTFFVSTTATNLSNFDPSIDVGEGEFLLPRSTGLGRIATLDLPRGVVIPTAEAVPAAFDPPFDRISVGCCTFCATSGSRRGAVRFDSRGRATFHSGTGAALDAWGASLTLSLRDSPAAAPTIPGFRLFVVTSSTGSVKSYSRG